MRSRILKTIDRYTGRERAAFLAVYAVAALSIILGAFLVPWQPRLGDEWAYAERAITLVDTLHTPYQSTPFDWWGNDAPWWTELSFHDHPPLIFWLRHFFTVSQTLDVLAHALSILVMYGIARLLFSRKFSVFAATVYAVSTLPMMISLHVMLESATLLFVLLSTFVALHAIKNKKYLPWWGVVTGIAILSKYTALSIVLAQALFFMFIFGKRLFQEKVFWYAVVLFLVVLAPVFIYNFMLFKTIGHFDMQWAYVFGQQTPEWSVQLGKLGRGTLLERIIGLKRVLQIFSITFWIVLLVQLGRMMYIRMIPMPKNEILLLALSTMSALGFAAFIFGTDVRFLLLTIPFIFLLSLWLMSQLSLSKYIWMFVFFAELSLMLGTVLPGMEYRLPGITVAPPAWYAHEQQRGW